MKVDRMLVFSVLLILSVTACSGSVVPMMSGFQGGDEFETHLTDAFHIDVGMLGGLDGPTRIDLSGSVSALSASGNSLYFLDRGTGEIVHLDLVTMEAKSLAMIRDGSSNGIIATLDGSVFVVDRSSHSIVLWTPFDSEPRRLPMGDLFTSPADIALTDWGRSLIAVDDLETRMVVMDLYGNMLRPVESGPLRSSHVTSIRAVGATNEIIVVLDADAGEVVGFDLHGKPVGSFATDELSHATALAVDLCGRFFVADDGKENVYIGFTDMLLPGYRTPAPGLTAASTSDLWTDGSNLYAATESSGIFVYKIDPECVKR